MRLDKEILLGRCKVRGHTKKNNNKKVTVGTSGIYTLVSGKDERRWRGVSPQRQWHVDLHEAIHAARSDLQESPTTKMPTRI